MRHYSLTDIELFLAVSDEENLTRGASRVGLSPSSASIRLKNIEEALQVKLFIRRKNGLELTRAGRVAAQEARRVVKDLDALEASLSPFAQMEKGILRITANYGASVDFLPDDISEYLVENPLARIVLEQKSSLEVIKTVAEGRADLGVGAYEGDYPGVVFRPYREDRLVLAVPAGHELAGRKELAFSESLAYPFVSLTDESAMQRFIFRARARRGQPHHAQGSGGQPAAPDEACLEESGDRGPQHPGRVRQFLARGPVREAHEPVGRAPSAHRAQPQRGASEAGRGPLRRVPRKAPGQGGLRQRRLLRAPAGGGGPGPFFPRTSQRARPAAAPALVTNL